MPSPTRTARGQRRSSAVRTTPEPSHHAQARISVDARNAIAQLAQERGVTESEIIRDAIDVYVFGAVPGASFTGPDNGYRVAKSMASVIARAMLLRAYQSMPETFEDFKRLIEEEGV